MLAAPYMTRDYLRMKLVDAKEKSWTFYIVIALITLNNWSLNPMIEHLNRRGIFTNYWVINDDDEIRNVLRTATVQGIMTDRPKVLQRILKEHEIADALKKK